MENNLYRKGFTILELLVVISIILIIIGLAAPRFGGYRKKANELKCESYAKQLYIATMASYAESGGKFIEGDIDKNISNLVNLGNGESGYGISIIDEDKKVSISFAIENKKYKIIVDKHGYKVKDNG